MSDVLGVGRIVDEASEVLDSLDRPMWSHTVVEKIGRKTITSSTNVSKLDVVFLLIVFAVLVQALEHRLSTGKSWAAKLDTLLAPFGIRLLASGAYERSDAEGNSETGIRVKNDVRDWTNITALTALSPVGGFVAMLDKLMTGGQAGQEARK